MANDTITYRAIPPIDGLTEYLRALLLDGDPRVADLELGTSGDGEIRLYATVSLPLDRKAQAAIVQAVADRRRADDQFLAWSNEHAPTIATKIVGEAAGARAAS